MTTIEQHDDQPLSTPTSSAVRWRLFGFVGLTVVVAVVGVVAWVLKASVVDRWMAIHSGTDDLSGRGTASGPGSGPTWPSSA
jgi:type IV secretory pathway TrbF-like protein